MSTVDRMRDAELIGDAITNIVTGQPVPDDQARAYLAFAARIVCRRLWDYTDDLRDRVEKCSDPNNVAAGLVEGLFATLVAETALGRVEGVAHAIERLRTAQV